MTTTRSGGAGLSSRDVVQTTGRRPGDPIRPVVQSSATALVVAWLLSTFLSGWWLLLSDQAWFAFAGSVACLIVTLPLVAGSQRYDWLSPWTLLLLGVYLGYGIRGFAIALRLDGSRSTSQLFLLGQSEPYFFRPSVLVIGCLALVTLGYLAAGPRRRRDVSSGRDVEADLEAADPSRMSSVRVHAVAALCALVGLVAFVLYVRATGGFDASALSGKRATINDVNLDTSTYQSFGQYRVLGMFSAAAFWLVHAHYAATGVRRRPNTLRFWVLAALLLNALLLPVYASTRAAVVLVVVGAAMIEWALRGLPTRRAVALGIVALLLGTSVLTALRTVSQGVTRSVTVTTDTVLDTFVMTRTFSDLPTSANIIRAVPDRLPYANGDTIVGWVAAPVPRALWPDKPIVSAGPVIGRVLYGNERSGVPPGAIAESYWNFGAAGALLLSSLLGFALRWCHRLVTRGAAVSPQVAIVIGAITGRIGLDALSNSLGYAIFQAVQMTVLLGPLLWLVTVRQRSPRGR